MLIKDFEPEKLANLIDTNQLSYDVYLARSNSINLQIGDKLTWIESNNSSPMFNGVLEATITPSVSISDFNKIGFFKGKAVATACCFFFAGVVGVYWVSTLAAYREKGIGCHMMSAILNDALSEGDRVAILQSSVQGLSMYQKLGFSEFCKNVRYEWKS